MPLAHYGSLITYLLEQLGEGELRAIKPCAIIGEAIGMAVLASKHAGAARSTDGVGHKAISEAYALIGNAVDVGCLDVALVVGADGLV